MISHASLKAALDAAAPLAHPRRAALEALLGELDLESWLGAVDDSPYALEDWIGALLAFDAWLESREIALRPAAAMTGYLECCAMALPRALPLPDFAAWALENLERHGFDAARPASP